MVLFWLIVFIVSLGALVKGSDWLLMSAERIGLSLGLSPFIVGVTIVGIGTSLPELSAGVVAVLEGVSEIATANAIGSNIANILFVVGTLAVISKRIQVEKNLIDLDLPLLATATILFIFTAFDGIINLGEALLLVSAYAVYLIYTIMHKDETDIADVIETLPATKVKRYWWQIWLKKPVTRPPISRKDIFLLVTGSVMLGVGAKYVIDSVIQLSQLLDVSSGVIALVAIAFGTSLPEILVSYKAAKADKAEVALGNIIGSSVFNVLMVVGISGLVGRLTLDGPSMALGLPFLIAVTFLFIISGISRRIYMWEGSMFLLLYVFFIGKLTGSL